MIASLALCLGSGIKVNNELQVEDLGQEYIKTQHRSLLTSSNSIMA